MLIIGFCVPLHIIQELVYENANEIFFQEDSDSFVLVIDCAVEGQCAERAICKLYKPVLSDGAGSDEALWHTSQRDVGTSLA